MLPIVCVSAPVSEGTYQDSDADALRKKIEADTLAALGRQLAEFVGKEPISVTIRLRWQEMWPAPPTTYCCVVSAVVHTIV